MITESDLRAVLTDEARDISDPDEIIGRVHLAEPRRQPSVRRWLVPAAAAAAVVAAITAVGLVVGDRHNGSAGPESTTTLPGLLGEDLWYTMTVNPVAGYDVTYREFDRTAVSSSIMLPHGDGSSIGGVTAYAPGTYDATAVKKGQRTTVQGRPAYYGKTRMSGSLMPTLAWQPSPGRWIVIQGWNDTATRARHLDPLTEEMRVAAAVDVSAAEPIRLPFRVGYLPAGRLVRHVSLHMTKPAGETDLDFSLSGQVGRTPTGELTGRDFPPGFLSIVLQPSSVPGQFTPSNRKVDGHRAEFESLPGPFGKSVLAVDVGVGSVTLQGDYSEQELIKIFRSITLAPDIDDPATWFDATK